MAASVSSNVTINQPVERVFDYVTNVANHKVRQAGILDAEIPPDGPVGLGSIYQYTSEVMGGYPAAAEGMVKGQMQKSMDEQAQRIKQMVGG